MLTVGIGEYVISNDPNESIITYALGSCIAFIMYCPCTKHTGLAHIVLPERIRHQNNKHKQLKLGYFAEDIVPKFVEFFLKEIQCQPSRLQIHMIGGAQAKHQGDVFRVGERNAQKIKSILDQYQLPLGQVEVGGNMSRTVKVQVHDGSVHVKRQKMII